MQQVRSAQPQRRAQVELEPTGADRRAEPSALLLARDVAHQWHLRSLGRDGADGGAACQVVDDRRQRPGRAPDDGGGGISHLVEAGPRTVAQCGHGVGEAGRGDQMVGRHRQPAGAHAGGGLDEEAGDAVGAGVAEHVAVPARPRDAGAVSRPVLQLAVAPRHPAERRPPGAGRRLGQTGVGRRRRPGRIERRHVPGPTDHGHRALTGVGECGADGPAHVRLAPGVVVGRARAGAHRGHRLADGGEGRYAVAAVLHHVVPPAFGVGLARRRGQRGERVDPPPHPPIVVARRQRPTGGCVDRSHRPVVGQGPADRLPFRAELGERPERGSRHVGRQVAEQGDGRPQTRVTDPPQERRGVGRQLDEHDRRGQLVEGAHDRARRPRSVMSHAEQVQAGRGALGISRGRGRRRRTRPSRHGRAPPPRGTRATRPRRGSGHARPRRRRRRRCRPATAVRRRSGRRGRGRW